MKDNKRGFSIIDAMNSLFRFTNAGALNANEIALYVILLSKWNELGRPKEFNLSRGIILSNSGMLKNTFYRTRNKLRQKGLIDFTIRGGRKSTVYSLCPIYETFPGTFSGTFSGTQPGTIHREEKSRVLKEKKSYKEKKEIPQEIKPTKKYDPDENVPTEVYKQIEDRFGKPAIGIFKKNKVPLYFVKWIVEERKIPLRRVRNPVFYICSLAKDPDLFGDFNAWLAQEYKKGWDVDIPWMQQEA